MRASIRVELGERYAALGLPLAARAAFEAAAGEGDAVAPRRLAELALALGETAAARRHAAAAAVAEPGPAADLLIARAALADGEVAAARRGVARALEHGGARAHILRAQVARAERDEVGARAHALVALDGLLAAAPDDVDAELAAIDELAALIALLEAGAEAEARVAERPAAPLAALVSAALTADARVAETALAGAVAAGAGRAVRLRLLERRLGRRQPAEVRARATAELTALIAEQAGSVDDARDLALLARLHFALAAALEAEPGASARAEDAYRAGLRHRPGHAAAANQLAVLALARGAPDDALAAVEAALRIDPALGLAWRSAARALDAAGPAAAPAWLARLFAAAASGGVAAAAPRLRRATAEVARADVLGGVYAAGHRLKNRLGVVGARARAVRKAAGGGALEPRLAELERELTELHAEWAGYLRSMEHAGPRFERVAVAGLIAEAVAAAPHEPGVAVEVRVAAGLPDLRADRALLREALLNVLGNAVEACAEAGGRVVVTARARPAGGSGTLELEVADDGPGIAAADLPRLFSPGFTTKPAGSGIGLAVAARAVEAHHGRILIDRGPGGGAVVTLLLPADLAGPDLLPSGAP